MNDSQLGHFFGGGEYLGGELNSPVVEWLNKGSTAVWNPSFAAHLHALAEAGAAAEAVRGFAYSAVLSLVARHALAPVSYERTKPAS
eukprot:271618-Prorocentrum_minimum.AAC.1